MTQNSAVQFPTNSRIHIALAVKNLERSIAFYRNLLGQEPTKLRPRYAKFEVLEPSLNLALNEYDGATQPVNPLAHFGVQLKSTDGVREVADRLRDRGEQILVEDRVTCCYAVQDKIWATDPDGNKWEVYVVLDNDAGSHEPKLGQCCGSSRKVEEVIQLGQVASTKSAEGNAETSCCGLKVSPACC